MVGLDLVRSVHAQNPSVSNGIQLGITYLWLRRYHEAFEHFQETIEIKPRSGDSIFGMAGVAKWCLSKPNEAVALWKAGLKAKYARNGGLSIRMPMLLFFASTTKSGIFEKDSAERLLLAKINDERIRHWPGPISKMLVGKISENDLDLELQSAAEGEAANRRWLRNFYKIALQFDQMKAPVLKEAFRTLADTSGRECSDPNLFAHRIWCEEFFLARHVVDELN
jgi:tetratricopeptide (TPR) repeat protein